MSRSTRRADLDEIFSVVITVKKIRHQGRVSRRAGPEIEVEKPIIVHVSEICSHRRNRSVETGLMCDIGKGPISGVAIKLHGVPLPWQSEVGSHPLASGKVIARDKQVETAVVIVIPEPGWEAPLRFLDAEPGRDFFKRAIAAVVIEEVVLSIVRDVEIRVPVAIVVSPGCTFGERDAVNSRLYRNVLKRAVTFIAEKLAGRVLVSD